MSTEKVKASKGVDILKWIFMLVLLVAGAMANSLYGHISPSLRIVVGILLVIVVAAIGFTTIKGRKAWQYLKEARNEVRRVVWPTRQTTLQVTLMVAVVVCIVAALVFVLDQVILHLVAWLTGQTG